MENKKTKRGIIKESINIIKYPIEEARFKFHDLLQILIGASILAIPVGFTEETWALGENLPIPNILGLVCLSLIFITAFTYYQYHRQYHIKEIKGHWIHLIKRVVSTYIFSFLTVSLILILIERAPYLTEFVIAIKRVIIVTFPASMSAVIADSLK